MWIVEYLGLWEGDVKAFVCGPFETELKAQLWVKAHWQLNNDSLDNYEIVKLQTP